MDGGGKIGMYFAYWLLCVLVMWACFLEEV